MCDSTSAISVARYEVMTLLMMLMRCITILWVALEYIYMLVDGFLFVKMLYDPLL
jgi:hypothetical protein